MFDVVPVKVVRAQRPVSRRLMRASMGYSKPPPLKATHRWTGTPHASTSEKVVDGEVVATNLLSGFQELTGVTSGPGEVVTLGGAGGSGRGANIRVPVLGHEDSIQWIEVRSTEKFKDRETAVIHMMYTYYDADGNPTEGRTGHPNNGTTQDFPADGEWHWVSRNLRAWFDSTTDVATITFSILGGSSTSSSTLDVRRKWIGPEATPHEIPYFDGDFPDAPLGPYYRWTGTPHRSVSEKVVDGQVVAANLAPNPSMVAVTGGTTVTPDGAKPRVAGTLGGNTLQAQAPHWDTPGAYAMELWSNYDANRGSGYADFANHVVSNERYLEVGVTYRVSVDMYIPEGHPLAGDADWRPGLYYVEPPSSNDNYHTHYQNEPGVHRLSIEFTPREDRTGSYLRLYHYGLPDDPPVYYARLLMERLDGPHGGHDYFDGDTPDDGANDLWIDSATGRLYMRDNINYEWVLVPQGFSAHEWMDYGTEEYAVKPVTTKGTP